jgi:UDP-3-O-[3-hydroxymyristoyl] glucosamine N-acyltransferase
VERNVVKDPAPTVRFLAELVGGRVLGSGADVPILGINDLRSAGPDQVSFLGNARYEALARSSRAGAILVTPRDAAKFERTLIEVESPSAAFAKISALFAPPPVRDEPGIHPTAILAPDVTVGTAVSIGPHVVVGAGARIGDRVVVGANCFIGEQTVIGADSRLYPLVTVRERSILGERVILHSGVVIGGDGFGYEFQQGRQVKIPHTGYVQLDDEVEIGANSTVDRGRFGRTHLAEGVKVDNLVMIAHNVVIGAHSVIVAQTGISGSTTLGKYVTLAGQVGLAGHLTIGDRAVIAAQSGLNKDVPAGAVLAGHHAVPMRESLKLEALTRRLPELLERIKALEDKLRELQ